MTYSLPKLSYSYRSLEPFFDETTMKIHHTKHHQNYIDKTNNLLKNTTFSSLSINELVSILNEIILDNKQSLLNNAGGHLNHSFFWNSLKLGTKIPHELQVEIEKHFNSVDNFKNKFEEIALNHFGSGWVWLVRQDNILTIQSTMNQNNPLMGKKISHTYGDPIIGLDLWEHAYYLKYQNRRVDYIQAFWNVVDWEKVSSRLQR